MITFTSYLTTYDVHGEIANDRCLGCSSDDYNDGMADCVCWDQGVEELSEVFGPWLADGSGWWRISNMRLWDGEHSGYGYGTTLAEVLRMMTVNSGWMMRWEAVYEKPHQMGKIAPLRFTYSLSHHDAPTGSTSEIVPLSEDHVERLGLAS